MITKVDILKMVRHVKYRSQGGGEQSLMNPPREWVRGLFVFVFITAIGLVFSGYTYMQFNNLDETTQTKQTSVARYDEASIARALEQYEARAAVYKKITDTQAAVVPAAEPVASSTEEDLSEEEEAPASADEETVGGDAVETIANEEGETTDADSAPTVSAALSNIATSSSSAEVSADEPTLSGTLISQ